MNFALFLVLIAVGLGAETEWEYLVGGHHLPAVLEQNRCVRMELENVDVGILDYCVRRGEKKTNKLFRSVGTERIAKYVDAKLILDAFPLWSEEHALNFEVGCNRKNITLSTITLCDDQREVTGEAVPIVSLGYFSHNGLKYHKLDLPNYEMKGEARTPATCTTGSTGYYCTPLYEDIQCKTSQPEYCMVSETTMGGVYVQQFANFFFVDTVVKTMIVITDKVEQVVVEVPPSGKFIVTLSSNYSLAVDYRLLRGDLLDNGNGTSGWRVTEITDSLSWEHDDQIWFVRNRTEPHVHYQKTVTLRTPATILMEAKAKAQETTGNEITYQHYLLGGVIVLLLFAFVVLILLIVTQRRRNKQVFGREQI